MFALEGKHKKWKNVDKEWACGHFFRPLCLYSFYNLED